MASFGELTFKEFLNSVSQKKLSVEELRYYLLSNHDLNWMNDVPPTFERYNVTNMKLKELRKIMTNVNMVARFMDGMDTFAPYADYVSKCIWIDDGKNDVKFTFYTTLGLTLAVGFIGGIVGYIIGSKMK